VTGSTPEERKSQMPTITPAGASDAVATTEPPLGSRERITGPRSAAPDWQAIEASPEFRQLVAKRRRFVAPATVGFLSWYLGFILLAGYAEGFMGESIYQGFTVGYLIALSQFVMVWGLSIAYLRYSDRELDPLRAALVARAEGSL